MKLVVPALTRCRYPGKVRFPDEPAAVRTLKSMKASGKENKKLLNRLHAYLCPDGDHWHIGHDHLKRTKLDAPASIQPVANRIFPPES